VGECTGTCGEAGAGGDREDLGKGPAIGQEIMACQPGLVGIVKGGGVHRLPTAGARTESVTGKKKNGTKGFKVKDRHS